MYVFSGIGRVISKNERELRDAIERALSVSNMGYSVKHPYVEDLQDLINERLRGYQSTTTYQVPVDGLINFPTCAGIDELYGYRVLGDGTVMSNEIAAELKRMLGCWPYHKGKEPRDFLVEEAPLTEVELRRTEMESGEVLPYCEPRADMCFDAQGEKDTAVTQCQFDYLPDRGSDPCRIETRISYQNQNKYDPCSIKDFSVCAETAADMRRRLQEESAPAPSEPIPEEPSPEEPVPIPVDERGPAPKPSAGILEYNHLEWGQGPDEDVAGLIREYLNPALKRMGYRVLGENNRFNMAVCAAIKRTHPAAFPHFNCMREISDPEQYIHRATGRDSTGAPVPVSTIYDDPVQTIYDDPESVFEMQDTPIRARHDDPPVRAIYDPAVEAEEPIEEEDRSMMVFGVLAAVVVGGGAVYLMTRKKKKR